MIEILKVYNVEKTSCSKTYKQHLFVCKKDACIRVLVYGYYEVSEGTVQTCLEQSPLGRKMAGLGGRLFFTFHHLVLILYVENELIL